MRGVDPHTHTPLRAQEASHKKKEHLGFIPGIQDYVDLFMSDKMIGSDGALTEQGLIAVQK